MMNIISLFGGVECGYPAFDRAGININKYYSCEIDEYAKAITRYNISNIIDCGDITKFDFTTLKDIDIVIGGSPCTYWSIAKKDREITSSGVGFDLFMQYVRVLKETKPTYFLYENNNSIHKDIKDAISKELGVKPILINSSLVSAQSRNRVYWTNIPNVSQPKDKNIQLKDILEPAYHTKYLINQDAIPRYLKNGKPKGLTPITGKAKTVTASVHKGYGNDGLTCINIDNPNSYTHGDRIRRLTPLECEQLQTLPLEWTRYGKDLNGKITEISDTQRYKCIGNGWTTDIISHILSHIKYVVYL